MSEPGKRRFPREEALKVATELFERLEPYSNAIRVVGSLRRLKPMVGDIELLYVPKWSTDDSADVWFRGPKEINRVNAQLKTLLKERVLRKRENRRGTTTWGEKIKLAVHVGTGIPVDLFEADATNWYNLLVVRTGSTESNIRICQAARCAGLKWDMYGAGFRHEVTGELVHRVKSEGDVFEFVGLPVLPPERRI